ncbi:MAG: L-threonylcarbamoyladenylate synthase [Micropepsaceae bacterium]
MRPSSKPTRTRLLPSGPSSLAEAGTLIRSGELVAFPTETVYGLGTNAFQEIAVSSIFSAKMRPRINPLIVHVRDVAAAEKLVLFNEPASKLAQVFWPGALTLVLPRKEPCPLALLVSAGLDTVAVRSPAHEIARALLDAAGVPIAAPSANLSGHISPTTAEDALTELDGRVSMILDGGACQIGLESTIVGFEGTTAVLLRKGAVTSAAIEQIIGPIRGTPRGKLLAPGMMKSHYAPNAPVRLNATSVEENESLLGFGSELPPGDYPQLNLSPAGDLNEAAANLFSMLRILDKPGTRRIAVMPIPEGGLGEAINDRLARAAAPRDGWAHDAASLE